MREKILGAIREWATSAEGPFIYLLTDFASSGTSTVAYSISYGESGKNEDLVIPLLLLVWE